MTPPPDDTPPNILPPPLEPSWQQAACGLLVTDTTGRILRVNRTFCGWLGHAADDLVGAKRLQDLMTTGARILHQAHSVPLLQAQGSIAEVRIDLRHRDGHVVAMLLNATAHAHDGVALHEIALFQAADRDRREQELLRARRVADELDRKEREAQRALDAVQARLIEESARQQALSEDRALFAEQMMGIVSHDMRNPLSVVSLSAHVLGRGPLDEQQRQALARIATATSRANRLVADLLDFTQARLGGGIVVHVLPMPLHALVQDCVLEMSAAHPGRALTHVSEGHDDCEGDADRLSQLLGNLIGNAMTYGDPRGTVQVTSTIAEDTYSIAVHNPGERLAEDLLAALFEPLVRGPGGSPPGRSIGLGLYIVREIARAHGGTVVATSDDVAGTTFVATFPRMREAGPPSATA